MRKEGRALAACSPGFMALLRAVEQTRARARSTQRKLSADYQFKANSLNQEKRRISGSHTGLE